MKTMATPHNLIQLSRLAPIDPDDENLIFSMFKEEYARQIQTWALTNRNSRRKLLFSLLRGEHYVKAPATARPVSLASSRRVPDLVFESSRCRIDVNQSFTGRPNCRRVNVKRFCSPGADEVFHRTPLPRLDFSKVNPSLSEFLVKKLLTPPAPDQVLLVADDYVELLQELDGWLDKRAMCYPVDHLFDHPTLSPQSARVSAKRTFEEDHLFCHGYDPTPPSVPRTQGARRKSLIRTGTTTSEDFYGMDYRCGAEAKPVEPFLPASSGTPFARFPVVEPEPAPLSQAILAQSRTNARMCKDYRAVFEGPTCL
jgi:hypothetical protein